jgi:iron complex transport system substrate-binding protein
MTDQARAYPRLAWQAESTIALGPDLVLIGDSDRPVTKHILLSQGLRLHEITLIADLDTARRQVAEVAAVLGHPERGDKLIADIEAARARLHAAPKPPFATALLVNRGGYTAGERSLAAALLMEAGLKPPPGAPPVTAATCRSKAPDAAPGRDRAEQPARESDQGSYNLSHPALVRALSAARRIVLPPRLHDLRRRRADRGVRLSGGVADAAGRPVATMRTN